MVERSKGIRSRTRSILRKDPRTKGKISIGKLLRTYKVGERVCIKTDSSVHKGMPHTRFYGKIGVIEGKRGRSYMVMVPMGGKKATILVRPEHIEGRGD